MHRYRPQNKQYDKRSLCGLGVHAIEEFGKGGEIIKPFFKAGQFDLWLVIV